MAGDNCIEVYHKVYSFPKIEKEGKIRHEAAIAEFCRNNLLFYIPIISSIFAAVMLSSVIKMNDKLSAEDKALIVRCIIALTPIGLLLVIADAVGTALRNRAKKEQPPTLLQRVENLLPHHG